MIVQRCQNLIFDTPGEAFPYVFRLYYSQPLWSFLFLLLHCHFSHYPLNILGRQLGTVARPGPAHEGIEIDVHSQFIWSARPLGSGVGFSGNNTGNKDLLDEGLASMDDAIVVIAAVLVATCRTNRRMRKALTC